VDKEKAGKIFDQETEEILKAIEGTKGINLYKQLKNSANEFSKIKLNRPYEKIPKVMITGEFFVRWDSGSNLNMAKRLTDKGFGVKVTPVAEWIYYLNYMIKNKIQIPEYKSVFEKIEFVVSDVTQQYIEKKIKKVFEKSNLYKMDMTDIEKIVKYSEHIVPKKLAGEPGLIIGEVLKDGLTKYSGFISIGPFGCMPLRYTEALFVPENSIDKKDKIPFLTVESDGNPYPQVLEAKLEAFCLQVQRVGLISNQ